VVHRDLKPANVIIDDRGQPRLIDFGLARRSDLESDLTRDGAILGTPAYMSPEQALGRTRQVDERTDVYSLGVIFYELLTGHHPDEPSTTSSDPPKPPKPAGRVAPPRLTQYSVSSALPRGLQTICKRAMAADPGARYPTARALADELGSWISQQERHEDRLRLALAGTIAGVGLALVLLIAFVLATVMADRAAPLENAASSLVATSAPSLLPTGRQVLPPSEPEPSARPIKSPVAPGAGAQLIGNNHTHVYHRAGCSRVRQLAGDNRVMLAGPAEAAAGRFEPCQTCNPPMAPGLPAQLGSSGESRKSP
jgi:serine/threonine protein kinase